MSLDYAPEQECFSRWRKRREANILILTDADRADERLAADMARRRAKLIRQAQFNSSRKRDREGRFA